jgi:hypothetical protein
LIAALIVFHLPISQYFPLYNEYGQTHVHELRSSKPPFKQRIPPQSQRPLLQLPLHFEHVESA